MRREERVTVQGPVKKQPPDGMSHRGRGVRAQTEGSPPPPRGASPRGERPPPPHRCEPKGGGRLMSTRAPPPPPPRHRKGAAHWDGTNGTSRHIQHSPNTPTTGLRERGSNTSKSTGRSGRQNAATRRNMRREERVTVQGPVKEQQPDGMSHAGGGGGAHPQG